MDKFNQAIEKSIILKNWVILAAVLPIIGTFLIISFVDFPWDNEFYRNLFINSSFTYGLFCVTAWIIIKHRYLFQKGRWLRNIAIVVAACVVLLWTYKHKITFRFDILLLFIAGLYSLVYRKWKKPDTVILTFFAFVIMKYLGILWSDNIAYTLDMVKEEMLIFSFLVPIICLGFRVNIKEQYAFINICFKLFLFLLACNFMFYLIYVDFSHNQLFNFFTFNKAYMNFLEVLSWSYFKHPSFISWIFLVVGGLGALVRREKPNLISVYEIMLYAVLLLFFVFIVQSRIGILGYFIAIALLVWFHFSDRISPLKKYILMTLAVIFAIAAIAFLTTKTSYFSDPIRNNTFNIVYNQIINQSLLFGEGTATQRFIMKDTGIFHVHNDFISVFIDLGIIGLALFVFWIISVLKIKDRIIQYTMLIFLLIMNTDVLFCFYLGTYITVPFLFFIFFADVKTVSAKDN